MKFSAVLLATLLGSTAAFAPVHHRPAASAASTATANSVIRAATLEAPPAEEEQQTEDNDAAITEAQTPVAAGTNVAAVVEKDWPVESNFVKDSDRILP